MYISYYKLDRYSLERRLQEKYHRFNCKGMFKYYIPKKVYDLIEYSRVHNHFYVDFFTLDEDYKSIWNEFQFNKSRYGRCVLGECGWDDLNDCYCIEIFLPFVLEGIREMNSPYRYRGLEVYIRDAEKLGYDDVDEITKDWQDYHNRVGRQFEERGLLFSKNLGL